MSASVNLATSQSAYCNPSIDPEPATEPATEGQATCEAVDDVRSGQAANYDDVDPMQGDICQEIDQGPGEPITNH